VLKMGEIETRHRLALDAIHRDDPHYVTKRESVEAAKQKQLQELALMSSDAYQRELKPGAGIRIGNALASQLEGDPRWWDAEVPGAPVSGLKSAPGMDLPAVFGLFELPVDNDEQQSVAPEKGQHAPESVEEPISSARNSEDEPYDELAMLLHPEEHIDEL